MTAGGMAKYSFVAKVAGAVVFDGVFLLLAPPNTTVGWASLGLLNLLYVSVQGAWSTAPLGRVGGVFGYPLSAIATCFFLIELVATAVLLLVPGLEAGAEAKPRILLAGQLVLAGTYAVMYFVTASAGQRIGLAVELERTEVAFIREGAEQVQRLKDAAEDPELRSALSRVDDSIRYGPVASLPSLAAAEEAILDRLRSVDYAIRDGNVRVAIEHLRDVERLVAQRTSLIRLDQ